MAPNRVVEHAEKDARNAAKTDNRTVTCDGQHEAQAVLPARIAQRIQIQESAAASAD